MSFKPTDLDGLQGWWDANDPATISGVEQVEQWADKSGHGHHLSEPLLGPNYIAEERLLRFQGPANSSSIGQSFDLPPMAVQTVICYIHELRPVTANNRYHAVLGHSTNRDSLYIDLPVGSPATYGVRPKNGLNSVSCNGGPWLTQTVVNATVPLPLELDGDIVLVEYIAPVTNFTWVAASGVSRNYRPNYDLGELMIFDRALSLDEKHQVEGYLAHKWGRVQLLPDEHPYKSQLPGGALTVNADSAWHNHFSDQVTLGVAGSLLPDSGQIKLGSVSPLISVAHTLSMDDIEDRRIFQRRGGKANIALQGTYTGITPHSIEACVMLDQHVVVSWQALSGLSFQDNSWCGIIADVPQGGMYSVALRARGEAGEVVAHTSGQGLWGVGDLYGIIGSSSAERWFTIGSGYTPHPLISVYNGEWRAQSSIGAAAHVFGNKLAAASNVPIGFLNYGVGGSRLSQWALASSVHFQKFASALDHVETVCAVILVVGMNDARAKIIASQAAHEAGLRALVSHIRGAAQSPNLPVFIWGAQRCLQPDMDDRQFAYLRNAEQAVGEDSNVYLGTTTVDLPLMTDKLHLTENGMALAAERVARAVTANVWGAPEVWRGSRISYARHVQEGQLDVSIEHVGGTDFGPAEGVTGFEISEDDFSTLLEIVAAKRSASDLIKINYRPVSGGLVKLRYQYGAGPDISAAIVDNSEATLPLRPTSQVLLATHDIALVTHSGLLNWQDDGVRLDVFAPVFDLYAASSLQALISSQAFVIKDNNKKLSRQTLKVFDDSRCLAVGAE